MLKMTIVSLAVVLCSCSTSSRMKADFDKVKVDMASFNKNLRGNLLRKDLKDDLSSMNMEMYLKYTKEKSAPSEIEYIEFLNDQKPEGALTANKNNFAVCLKAVKLKQIICDIGRTGFTDFESKDMSIDILEKVKSFDLNY